MKLPVFKGPLNAYSEDANASKERFLRDAGRFLRRVGYELEKHGLSEMRISPNKGGAAVSGEVYGDFRRPSDDVGIFVEIGTTAIASRYARKQDQAVIRSVWRCRRREDCHTPEGPNVYLDPNADSVEIAVKLLEVLADGIKSEAQPQ